ncbi:MAG: hypothetical protein ACRDQB_01175 [Thermocrispum sp.]
MPDHYDVPDELPSPSAEPPDSPLSLPHPAPAVPGGAENPGQGVTTVSTEAITVFSNNLQQLEEPIRFALGRVSEVNVRAGAFNQAHVLAGKINGDGGLAESTRKVLTQALDALAEIRESCARLALEYESAEELNAADATEFQRLVNRASSVINSVGASR